MEDMADIVLKKLLKYYIKIEAYKKILNNI